MNLAPVRSQPTLLANFGGNTIRILIIEDEELTRKLLRKTFEKEGFHVDECQDGETGLELAAASHHDLILLDIGLPGMDGFQVIQTLRGRGVKVPLLVLTSMDSEEGLVRSLDLGADNFIRKPFSMGPLLAHVRALLRRSTPVDGLTLGFGGLELDLRRRVATRADQSLRLTGTQFKLLTALVQAQGEVVRREDLLKKVWGLDFDPHTKVLDVQLSYVRKKLQKTGPPMITSVRGVGYRLEADSQD